jgi:hypothetical protein
VHKKNWLAGVDINDASVVVIDENRSEPHEGEIDGLMNINSDGATNDDDKFEEVRILFGIRLIFKGNHFIIINLKHKFIFRFYQKSRNANGWSKKLKRSVEKQNWRNEKGKDLLVVGCNSHNAGEQNNHVCRLSHISIFYNFIPKLKTDFP